ncbi:MAG: carbonic anhydrase [Desulfarculaceae bacterium]|nr:carbonic anhydrase [Desulfarculaceae bacterium]MCF8072848.1 carbonic anhydrase [Desulfarculaceae bacterium]MCF8101016.1 carbonic anhydrase [Desulfarculaceae bacterium]MCF8115597.1 carbonic anhydrase [Desulfarculaceae bacterium]
MSDPQANPPHAKKPTPSEVLAILAEGNRRFWQDSPIHPNTGPERLEAAHQGDQAHHALATVLSCSDSRVPVERIFDAGIMDLFVVRVAGNIVAPVTAASMEYGALHVHTPLLVVLGHTSCGAVTAAWNRRQQPGGELEPNIAGLLEYIEPALDRVPPAPAGDPGHGQVDLAVEENIWQALGDLGRLSPLVRQACAEGTVAAVGAVYNLEYGQVRWLDQRKAAEMVAGRR